ncbi:hypothetical protein [Salinithrix halophila]|uniref:Uncharacterized protein n=1 Tax=Salinithrix halophila TaxID=1485204 RepID=A0ABV8JHU3_9BACL
MQKLARRLFASIFLSVMAAALLSLVPALEEQGRKEPELPVFRPDAPVDLTEHNLVDFLARRPPGLEVRRADWKAGTLNLSLSASGSEERRSRELLTLIRSLLVHTENVNTLRLEVEADVYRFLIDAKRADLDKDPGMKGMNSTSPESYLLRTFRVIPSDEGN